MITTNKEDAIILYAFQMCIENDTEEIENILELEEIIAGATDKIIDDFNELSNEKRNTCALRINSFLKTYNYER